MRINRHLEIVRFDAFPDPRTGYRCIQVAIDGKLAVPMDIHESNWAELSEDGRMAKLMHDGLSLLRHFGDCRKVRYREDGSYISLEEGSEFAAMAAQ